MTGDGLDVLRDGMTEMVKSVNRRANPMGSSGSLLTGFFHRMATALLPPV